MFDRWSAIANGRLYCTMKLVCKTSALIVAWSFVGAVETRNWFILALLLINFTFLLWTVYLLGSQWWATSPQAMCPQEISFWHGLQ